MPFECPIQFCSLSDSEFACIDRNVMACVYASHNELGRLCEERVYENDIAGRLRARGVGDIRTQVPLTARHRGFAKTYRLDLVVGHMVYELKVAGTLAPVHDAQVFNYAAMLAVDRIKLINLGGASVEGLLRRCPFTRIERNQVRVNRERWRPVTARCETLAADAAECFADWGGFIDAGLVQEALVWFSGGEAVCERRLAVVRDGLPLGHHRAAMHADDMAFVATGLGDGATGFENQLRRLLGVLPLRGWQWMDINGTEIRLVTIER